MEEELNIDKILEVFRIVFSSQKKKYFKNSDILSVILINTTFYNNRNFFYSFTFVSSETFTDFVKDGIIGLDESGKLFFNIKPRKLDFSLGEIYDALQPRKFYSFSSSANAAVKDLIDTAIKRFTVINRIIEDPSIFEGINSLFLADIPVETLKVFRGCRSILLLNCLIKDFECPSSLVKLEIRDCNASKDKQGFVMDFRAFNKSARFPPSLEVLRIVVRGGDVSSSRPSCGYAPYTLNFPLGFSTSKFVNNKFRNLHLEGFFVNFSPWVLDNHSGLEDHNILPNFHFIDLEDVEGRGNLSSLKIIPVAHIITCNTKEYSPDILLHLNPEELKYESEKMSENLLFDITQKSFSWDRLTILDLVLEKPVNYEFKGLYSLRSLSLKGSYNTAIIDCESIPLLELVKLYHINVEFVGRALNLKALGAVRSSHFDFARINESAPFITQLMVQLLRQNNHSISGWTSLKTLHTANIGTLAVEECPQLEHLESDKSLTEVRGCRSLITLIAKGSSLHFLGEDPEIKNPEGIEFPLLKRLDLGNSKNLSFVPYLPNATYVNIEGTMMGPDSWLFDSFLNFDNFTLDYLNSFAHYLESLNHEIRRLSIIHEKLQVVSKPPAEKFFDFIALGTLEQKIHKLVRKSFDGLAVWDEDQTYDFKCIEANEDFSMETYLEECRNKYPEEIDDFGDSIDEEE